MVRRTSFQSGVDFLEDKARQSPQKQYQRLLVVLNVGLAQTVLLYGGSLHTFSVLQLKLLMRRFLVTIIDQYARESSSLLRLWSTSITTSISSDVFLSSVHMTSCDGNIWNYSKTSRFYLRGCFRRLCKTEHNKTIICPCRTQVLSYVAILTRNIEIKV